MCVLRFHYFSSILLSTYYSFLSSFVRSFFEINKPIFLIWFLFETVWRLILALCILILTI